MTITARVVEDSLSPDGIRLTTFLLRYPRFIHAEVMTHRVFSRNGRSSRAVPVKRLLLESIVQPVGYEANRPGMTSVAPLTGWRKVVAQATWLGMAHLNKLGVRILHGVGLHKQWANRPLEWFGCIDVLVTATDWANFFALRLDKGTQPELQILAGLMDAAMVQSSPRLLSPGQWHMPFVDENERATLTIAEQLVLSTARCARLTIEPFDGNADYAAERARYERLVVSTPVHASPAEHQATPDEKHFFRDVERWKQPHLHGNFRGYVQHRQLLKNHVVADDLYDFDLAVAA
ncbi:hypothetical protein FV222_00375 [Methylobacterium sp. WL103]|uniref:hypothetical protein n=1 Tax=Methylobacterium sp. WL103 TaxID=2603891 RepID=UPI0011CBF810|nr:hypothetical protein [Methylobacterium sp. WL103]TXN08960.1 hypothetical protein FV222_00375 [Methylobacterium sp. WL103]